MNSICTHFLPQERHVVVGLLRRRKVRQCGPDGSSALAVVLLLLHIIFGPVEGEHAELSEKALQDGLLARDGPQLLGLHHRGFSDARLLLAGK